MPSTQDYFGSIMGIGSPPLISLVIYCLTINQTITHNSFSCFTVLYSEYKELHELLFFREVPDVAAVASIHSPDIISENTSDISPLQ